jgi:hypothetical protein
MKSLREICQARDDEIFESYLAAGLQELCCQSLFDAEREVFLCSGSGSVYKADVPEMQLRYAGMRARALAVFGAGFCDVLAAERSNQPCNGVPKSWGADGRWEL